jgi:hypothetical protein
MRRWQDPSVKLVHFADGFVAVGLSTMMYDSYTTPTSASLTVATHAVGSVGCGLRAPSIDTDARIAISFGVFHLG